MNEKNIYRLSAAVAAFAVALLFLPGRQTTGQPGKISVSPSYAARGYVDSETGGREMDALDNARPDKLFLPGRGHATAGQDGPPQAEKSVSKLQLLGIFQYGTVKGAIIDGVAPRRGAKGIPPKVFKIGEVVDNGLLLTDVQERKAVLSSSAGKVTLELKKTAAAGGDGGNGKP